MEHENVTIVYSEKINKEDLDRPTDKMIIDSLDVLIDGLIECDKPKRMVVEIHVEDEYGKDLPNHTIFDMVEKNFEENKSSKGLDYCRIYKINEYVIVIGGQLWNIYSSILNVPIALTELELWSIKNEFKEIEIVKLIDSDREYKLLVDGALNKR